MQATLKQCHSVDAISCKFHFGCWYCWLPPRFHSRHSAKLVQKAEFTYSRSRLLWKPFCTRSIAQQVLHCGRDHFPSWATVHATIVKIGNGTFTDSEKPWEKQNSDELACLFANGAMTMLRLCVELSLTLVQWCSYKLSYLGVGRWYTNNKGGQVTWAKFLKNHISGFVGLWFPWLRFQTWGARGAVRLVCEFVFFYKTMGEYVTSRSSLSCHVTFLTRFPFLDWFRLRVLCFHFMLHELNLNCCVVMSVGIQWFNDVSQSPDVCLCCRGCAMVGWPHMGDHIIPCDCWWILVAVSLALCVGGVRPERFCFPLLLVGARASSWE